MARKDSDDPLNLDVVLGAELQVLRGTTPSFPKTDVPEAEDVQPATEMVEKDQLLAAMFKRLLQADLTALCFSGGGIRSATFGLGIVQALAAAGLLSKFDYLSTVSGGGYLGSWLSAWIKRVQSELFQESVPTDTIGVDRERLLHEKYNTFDDRGVKAVQDALKSSVPNDKSGFDPSIEPKQLQFLREYSNYMTPKVGLLSADTWTFIGIYLRNLTLNWTIFIPLIASVLLLPEILKAILRSYRYNVTAVEILCAVAAITAGITLYVVLRSIPSSNEEVDRPSWSGDGGVVLLALTPLLITAEIVTTLVWWHAKTAWWNVQFGGTFDFYPFSSPHAVYVLAGVPVVLYIFFKTLIQIESSMGFLNSGAKKRTLRDLIRLGSLKKTIGVMLSAMFASFLGGVFIQALIKSDIFRSTYPETYVAFAVPAFLGVFLAAATLFVGFASKLESDGDREWFARFGSWILIAAIGWMSLCTLTFWGPSALIGIEEAIVGFKNSPDDWKAFLEMLTGKFVALIGALSAVISLFGGFSGLSKVRDGANQSRIQKFLAFAPQIAAVIFLIFILAGIALMTRTFAGSQFMIDLCSTWGIPILSVRFQAIFALALFAVSLLMAWFINVNKFSLHGAYRDRLIRAYLGASKVKRKADPFTGFDDADNFQLHRLRGQRPLHIINATLNLVDGENLAWQNRMAASFIMSPLHCGSWALKGFRESYRYNANRDLGICPHLRYCNQPKGMMCDRSVDKAACTYPGKALRLGTAMAISGAAANPNMGYYSSSVVMFLMAMFNIRLGWWLGNTNKRGGNSWFGPPYYEMHSPRIAIAPLVSETLGKTDAKRHFINVSDGGHFENLGLYEMVLRRCKFIVVSDAGADNTFAFDDLANAIEKCKVDLGVEIVFEDGINIPSRHGTEELSGPAERFAIARINYPEMRDENDAGFLLYIKPTILKNEPIELKHYVEANPSFPHQSTADQLFDEQQFEAYRKLGFLTMDRILERRKNKSNNLSSLFEGLKD